VGVSLGKTVNSISVWSSALRRMEFDNIKLTPTNLSTSDTLVSDEDDEEVYSVSDG
jgi:hypothetical protein